jgi:L-asparaginase
MPGRISDSATVAGNYANEFCGVSLTELAKTLWVMQLHQNSNSCYRWFSLEEACAKTLVN